MNNDMFNPLIKSFLGQMDSAMKISDILAKHDNSDEIKVDHLISGLVYRLMVPMSNEEITESLESAQEIVDKLEQTDSEEEDELDNSAILDENISFGSRKVKSTLCNCKICSKARVCLLNYHNYECSDPLADKFKAAIMTSCEKHKIYI